MSKPPVEHLMILKTTSRSNVEEIWRKQGWVPPSTEDQVVIKRQAESRGEYGMYIMRRKEDESPRDKNLS